MMSVSSREFPLAKRRSAPPRGKVDAPLLGDKLAPARGIIVGLALTLPFWAILGGIAWVLRR